MKNNASFSTSQSSETTRNNEKQREKVQLRKILEPRHKSRATLWELDHHWAVQLLWPEPNSLFQFLNYSNHFKTNSRRWAPRTWTICTYSIRDCKRNNSTRWLFAHNDEHQSLLLAIAHYSSTRAGHSSWGLKIDSPSGPSLPASSTELMVLEP